MSADSFESMVQEAIPLAEAQNKLDSANWKAKIGTGIKHGGYAGLGGALLGGLAGYGVNKADLTNGSATKDSAIGAGIGAAAGVGIMARKPIMGAAKASWGFLGKKAGSLKQSLFTKPV